MQRLKAKPSKAIKFYVCEASKSNVKLSMLSAVPHFEIHGQTLTRVPWLQQTLFFIISLSLLQASFSRNSAKMNSTIILVAAILAVTITRGYGIGKKDIVQNLSI